MSNSKMFVPGAALDGLRLALEAENKKLRARVEVLEAENKKLRVRVEDLERVYEAAKGIWDPFYALHAAISQAALKAARRDTP